MSTEAPSQIVSFQCVLKNRLGQVLSFSYNSEVLMDLRTPTIEPMRDLIAGLQNLKKGEKREIFLPADRAFGLYRDDLVVKIPRSRLMKNGPVELGTEILIHTPGEDPRFYRVIDLTSKHALVDGNHPFAGQDLYFEIEATEVREATSEEILRSQSSQLKPGPNQYLH